MAAGEAEAGVDVALAPVVLDRMWRANTAVHGRSDGRKMWEYYVYIGILMIPLYIIEM